MFRVPIIQAPSGTPYKIKRYSRAALFREPTMCVCVQIEAARSVAS